LRRWLQNPMAIPTILSLGAAVVLCSYVGVGEAPSITAERVLDLGWALMAVFWMDADARQRRRIPCFDFTFLAAIYFPVSLFWYCVWSRGWGWGLLLLSTLFGLWLLPHFLAVAFWVALQVVG
jgi:hypothetical protein